MDFSKFGFDLGYVQSFYKAESKIKDIENNFSSIYLFPTYIIPLNNSTAFKAKAGYAKNKSSDDGIGYGVDIIFQVNRKSGFSLGFQKMNREINIYGNTILILIWKIRLEIVLIEDEEDI